MTLATPPTSVCIWARQASDNGTRSIVWPVENGGWTAVVMNAVDRQGTTTHAVGLFGTGLGASNPM